LNWVLVFWNDSKFCSVYHTKFCSVYHTCHVHFVYCQSERRYDMKIFMDNTIPIDKISILNIKFEWVLLNMKRAIFSYIMARTRYISSFFYAASSLKQQSMDGHVASLAHIILISSQSVFALIPYCCMLSREATNTNFIVFSLTQSELEPMIYHSRGVHANHFTTDAVDTCCWYMLK
jgi:hypothetical protein